MLVLLIAFALRHMGPTLRYIYETWDWVYSPNEPWRDAIWFTYFAFESGFAAMTAPFVFALSAVFGWLVPCEMAHQRHQFDATDSGPPDRELSAWQFGVKDLLAGTAAIAAVMSLIAWVQPYPTWILEYGRNAVVFTGTFFGVLQIPNVVTCVLGTWFSGYFLLSQTIRPRYLAILVLLAAINCMPNVLINDVILPVANGMGEFVLVPRNVWLTVGWTFLSWIILAISFLLLRIAGFRITRARSRLLRR